MKVIPWILLLSAISASYALADGEFADGDVFFGFSSLRSNDAKTILPYWSLGGIGTFGFNINEHVGIEAEFGGYHNGYVDSFHDNTNSVTYLFGPRLSYGRTKRIDPYLHLLVGGLHTATSVLKQPAPAPLIVGNNSPRFTESQDGFTVAIGGGVDIKLNHIVTFRPIQLDYLPTRLGEIGPSGLSHSSFRHNFRYTIGFMFEITDH